MNRLALILWASITLSCSNVPTEDVRPSSPVPQTVRDVLYGGDRACEQDADCPGTVCESGSCIGVLLAPSSWLQKRAASRAAEVLSQDPELRDEALLLLGAGLTQPGTHASLKSRTIPLLEALDARPLLELLAASSNESLAAQASLALCRLGHDAMFEACARLSESSDLSISSLALEALADGGYPDTLGVLLGTLNPDLDTALIRAALRALERANDPRSIRPLVTFLADAPDHLKVPTARVLRSVTKVDLGLSHDAWTSWVSNNPPPESPPFSLRASDSTEILGIPEP